MVVLCRPAVVLAVVSGTARATLASAVMQLFLCVNALVC